LLIRVSDCLPTSPGKIRTQIGSPRFGLADELDLQFRKGRKMRRLGRVALVCATSMLVVLLAAVAAVANLPDIPRWN
jgi:hypothetical protein